MDALISWVLPTTRVSGRPLDPADISHARVEMSANGVDWTLIGDFAPDVLDTTVQGLDIGVWSFRLLVADTNGRVSDPVVVTAEVPDETAPSPGLLQVVLQ